MTFVIKRKFQGALGGDVDNQDMATLVQHIQTNTVPPILTQETLIVNHLVVKRTMKIPVGADKYK